mmetsp:Transcript_48380/g.112053  ORF Transcript_48380/g.112053 Transcript_48380/m.112053 type:complete len:213 (+) Transcript_48380:307-945(+)
MPNGLWRLRHLHARVRLPSTRLAPAQWHDGSGAPAPRAPPARLAPRVHRPLHPPGRARIHSHAAGNDVPSRDIPRSRRRPRRRSLSVQRGAAARRCVGRAARRRRPVLRRGGELATSAARAAARPCGCRRPFRTCDPRLSRPALLHFDPRITARAARERASPHPSKHPNEFETSPHPSVPVGTAHISVPFQTDAQAPNHGLSWPLIWTYHTL